jgi:hypothetical protein
MAGRAGLLLGAPPAVRLELIARACCWLRRECILRCRDPVPFSCDVQGLLHVIYAERAEARIGLNPEKDRIWMVLRTLSPVGLLLILLPLCALAQAGSPDARIEAAMQRARAAGLPVALLESKVNEGRAKNVPLERIAAAVEQRLESAKRAREVMRQLPNLGVADLSVGADALEAGVGEPTLAALVREAPAELRTVAIAVLTQLVHLGEQPQPALGRVREAMQQGRQALQRLPAEAAARQRGRGAQP